MTGQNALLDEYDRTVKDLVECYTSFVDVVAVVRELQRISHRTRRPEDQQNARRAERDLDRVLKAVVDQTPALRRLARLARGAQGD